jgi:hypothetical protein
MSCPALLCVWQAAAGSASASIQALDGLPADLGYDLEVFIEMENRETSEFRRRRDNEVRS